MRTIRDGGKCLSTGLVVPARRGWDDVGELVHFSRLLVLGGVLGEPIGVLLQKGQTRGNGVTHGPGRDSRLAFVLAGAAHAEAAASPPSSAFARPHLPSRASTTR